MLRYVAKTYKESNFFFGAEPMDRNGQVPSREGGKLPDQFFML